ncbi:MAG TPA: hypothetical protein VFT04_04200 [Gemmatimonadales bacterium]|nr:hypothetical protein [Gemmatimonadales bacterium]
MSPRMVRWVAAVAVVLLPACGGEKADTEAGTPIVDSPGASAGKVSGLPEKSATVPASPCEWIPGTEVEAVVGKLNGPPRAERGGCFYPLPVDSITIARRAKADEMRAALERVGMKSDLPPEPVDTGGVFIQVSVGSGAEERAAELAFGTMGSWVGDDSLFATQQAGDGWDYRRALPGKPNFMGRAGTVFVVIEGGTHGMEDSVLAVLATRVRDRIPDLPFVDPNAASGAPTGRDPCSVLSREDAEAVLGKLVVAPYRASEGRALAHPGGGSCAYYTGRHRALVLTPHFVGGADEMRFVRGRGGLGAVGIMDREAEGADTLEGPWDEVAIGVDGELAMMKGERMLEIAFLTSSTDIAGAMRLAAPALQGLAAAR